MNTRHDILINERVVLRRLEGCSGHRPTRSATEVRKSLRRDAPLTAPLTGHFCGRALRDGRQHAPTPTCSVPV
jgi:hypothetical protein